MTTLIVIDQPPYGSWTGREALDMTFSLAAFDQPAAMLFLGAGVHWLCKGQAADAVGLNPISHILEQADLHVSFHVVGIWVHRMFSDDVDADDFI